MSSVFLHHNFWPDNTMRQYAFTSIIVHLYLFKCNEKSTCHDGKVSGFSYEK